MSALAERYAEAVWRLAKTPEVGDRVVRDIVAFLALQDSSPQLRQVLSDPALRPRVAHVVRAIVARGQGHALTQTLLLWLLKQGRLALLYDIGWTLARRVDKASGRLRAHVTAAAALSAAQQQALEQHLSRRFGKPVVADVRLDQTLLGGFVCRIGRLTFDGSIKRQLAQFAEASQAFGP